MENGLKGIRKDAFQAGVILGVVLLLLDIIEFYILGHSASVSLIFLSHLFVNLIIPLIVAIVLIKRLRRKTGGYWNLRQATSGIFIAFITAYILSAPGTFLFVKYINPSLIVEAKDNLVNVLSGFFDRINAEQDKVDDLLANIELHFNAVAQGGFGAVISNLLSSIIILFVTALIFAAIFKREVPHETISQNH